MIVKWKKSNASLISKIKLRRQIACLYNRVSIIKWYTKWKKELKCTNFINFGHISSIFTVIHMSLLLKNEEKVVVLLVYSSFKRVTINGCRIIPYSLVVTVE